MRTKIKLDPDALYEPTMSFTGELDGHPVVFNPSAKVRGDNPAVKKWPSHFVLADSSSEEKTAAYRELAGPPVVPDDAPIAQIVEQLSGPGVVEARDSYNFGDHYVPKGKRFHDSHEFVQGWPECFRPAVES